MTKHVMAITYPPKIEPVKDGRCIQTIRKGRKVSVGDEILFHGWSGKPYRSKWDWRKRVTIVDIIPTVISIHGMFFPTIDGLVHKWTDPYPTKLARFDFIDPTTGEALRDVLFGLNGAPNHPEEYQIIRWTI